MITSGFRSRTSFHAQLFTLISIVILLIHPLHHVVSASSDATSVATEAETMMDKNSAEGASPPEHTDDASPSTTTPPGAAPVQEGAQLARARFVAGKDMTPFPDPVCAKDPGRNLRCIYEGFDATTKHCNPRTMTIDNRTLSRALFFSCLHGSDGRCCTDPCYPRTINQCSGDQCIWVQYGTSGRCVSYHKLCWGSRSKQECENVAFCHWTPSKNDMESAKSEEKPGTDTEGTCEFYPPRQLSCGGVTFDSPDAETLCGSAIPGPMKALLALTGIAFAVAIAAIAYVIYRRIKKSKAVRGDISIGQ